MTSPLRRQTLIGRWFHDPGLWADTRHSVRPAIRGCIGPGSRVVSTCCNPADEEHNAAWSGLGTPHDRLKKAKARIDLELGLPRSRCGPELNLPCQFA